MEVPKKGIEKPSEPQQPSLIPDEPQKEVDWEAIKKAAEENQKRLKEERENEEKEEYWNH